MEYIIAEVFALKKILVKGGNTLNGEVSVHGAKNAVLPILAASILTGDNCVIHNCPDLSDVSHTLDIIRFLGYDVAFGNDTVSISYSRPPVSTQIPDTMMQKMRSSILFLGSLLNKYKYAKITLPGGCELGARPIDLHLKAFEQLGVVINERCGYYECFAEKIVGDDVYLDFPSVGATENIIILSCRCSGITVIHNAAKEPEIVDLQNFLNSAGAKIVGAGTDTVYICGVNSLHDTEYTVMPDRIVAATYLIAAAASNSEILVKDVCPDDLFSVMFVLQQCGVGLKFEDDWVRVLKSDKIKSIDLLRTMPYPGFPTDVQSVISPLLSIANGTSIISENLFESRFKHINELNRMGADISVMERNAVIRGVDKLYGANVKAMDLRGAAGLIVAGLCADGDTVIDGIEYLERGYDSFIENLNSLGAEINYIS